MPELIERCRYQIAHFCSQPLRLQSEGEYLPRHPCDRQRGNATGNFVKVVQRLPVRIELVDYNADQTPLFIGTSVVPPDYINEPPTGPDAGKFLQAYAPQSPSPGPTAGVSGARQ